MNSRYWQSGGRDFKGTELVYTPFSGFGAFTVAQQQELNSVMDSAVGAMNGAADSLRKRVALESAREVLLKLAGPAGWFTMAFTSTDDARAAALSGLKTIQNIIDRLNGPSRQAVLNGAEAPEKWLAASKTVLEGIQDQAKILGDSSLATFAGEQYAATKQAFADFLARAGQTLKETWDIAKYALPIGIGVAAVAALFILPKVFALTPAGRIARAAVGGYSKKRRRKKRMGWWEPEMQLEGYSRRR